MNSTNLIFTINPQLKDVPKMEKFLEKRYHITFEKADNKNAINWFNEANGKGWLPAMKAHRNMTNNFKWTNFDNWLKTIKKEEENSDDDYDTVEEEEEKEKAFELEKELREKGSLTEIEIQEKVDKFKN